MENVSEKIARLGFAVAENIYSEEEVAALIRLIENQDRNNSNFRKSKDLYAIRNLLQEVPGIMGSVMNEKLKALLSSCFREDYFAVKGIYFDKPPLSAWFVNWHQDLTISVDRKENIPGFRHWTMKAGQQAVQPSLEYLENILTARIHLDDTDANNGGLHVIPGSHSMGVIGDADIRRIREGTQSETGIVKSGGIMFMKPLILHASYKSVNNSHRRVIHIEFASRELPQGLKWRERMPVVI